MSLENRTAKKLQSTQGDTLVEVLIGLLIVVLAVTLLATMIVGSTKVTSQNESVMKSLYEAESLLSSRSATVKNPDVTELRITGDTSTYSDSVAIEAYETDGFACYDLAVSKEGLNE